MSYLFYDCNSLKSLPDLSKWNINNCWNYSGIFANCSSLLSLPDISKWALGNNSFRDFYFFFETPNYLEDKKEYKDKICYIRYIFY